MAHTFEGYVLVSTARAIMFQSHYWEHAHWFPRSQIEVRTQQDEDEVIITASDWICNMKRVREFTYHDHEPEPF